MNIHKYAGNRGFTLVELMIVIVIIGILAALASFGFSQYVKKSKTAEADEFVKKLADGSRSYFTSEQKYGGDEDYWHTAGAGPSTAGYTVPFGQKSYPGGPGWDFTTHATIPTAGTKLSPDALLALYQAGPSIDKSAINKLQFSVSGPTYFSYRYQTENRGEQATATISAVADFDSNVKENHTHTCIVSVLNGEVLVSPPLITNELE